jgi:hypothetical protein
VAGDGQSINFAMKILRSWSWDFYGPDGLEHPCSKDLCEVINRLAMEGLTRPQNTVLQLLCQGHIWARGDFRWRKYQSGSQFQLEESSALLKTRQWKLLADGMTEEWRKLETHEWGAPTVNLDMLTITDCAVYEWEFDQNRFSVALCPPDTPLYDPTYFEEWLSVWDIRVLPPAEQSTQFELVPQQDDRPEHTQPLGARGGRPPAKWWPDFAEELALFVHENGVPEGQGHDGQSAMIDAIFARLAKRGKSEPGRGTIQPVINAVLRRIRSAGN